MAAPALPVILCPACLPPAQICLDEAHRLGLTLPGLALAEQLYRSLSSNGGDRMGTQALSLVYEALNGQRPAELATEEASKAASVKSARA